MAKKKRSRRRNKTTLPIAVIAGAAAGMVKPVKMAVSGDVESAANTLSMDYIGYNFMGHKWEFSRIKNGLLPLVAGVVAHKVAGKLGVNRAIASTGIPYIRI